MMWKFWMNGGDKDQELSSLSETNAEKLIDDEQVIAPDESSVASEELVASSDVASTAEQADDADAPAKAPAAAPEAPTSKEVTEGGDEDEEISSNDGQAGSDDPMGEAYCLDDGTLLDDNSEEVLPWRSDVTNPKEFFSTEILYRYDILEASEQTALCGSYRLELKGSDACSWSITVTDELSVDAEVNDNAEVVISMQHSDFMNVINGRLNPQLAILAQKIKIKGDTRRAVIFQSLLTPSPE